MKRAPTARRQGVRCLGVLPVVLLGVACAARPVLQDEHRTAPYADLSARARAAERTHESVRVEAPGSVPVDLAFDVVRSPHGASRSVLVLQPGILADGSTWRFLVGHLVAEHDLLVIDPPGTGRSSVPDPARAGPAAYSPSWLAEYTLLALRDWQARQPAHRRLVLVGHSLGGTVILRMLADPVLRTRYADVRADVEGALLLAPADLAMRDVDPKWIEMATVSDLEATIGGDLGIVRTKVAEAVRENTVHPEKSALNQEADRIAVMLVRTPSRHAAQAMVLRFNPTDATGQRDLAAAQRLADQERSIDVPVLVLWGREDGTLPVATAQPLVARIPGARLHVIDGAKHSLHQECVGDVCVLLEEFVAAPAPPAPDPSR